jgi:hypothetical protein
MMIRIQKVLLKGESDGQRQIILIKIPISLSGRNNRRRSFDQFGDVLSPVQVTRDRLRVKDPLEELMLLHLLEGEPLFRSLGEQALEQRLSGLGQAIRVDHLVAQDSPVQLLS